MIRAGIVKYIRHREDAIGESASSLYRIYHAEIASVQISQGEYYFSGRYKDFFPEGERSFFVGKNWEEDMLKVAIYGKGGIGKSTVTSNLAAAFATMGKRVIQIGCDPKADSTINLLEGKPLRPVMNYMREEDEEPEKLEDISKEGFGGVLCIETGGPTPGLGCAGRGIIATFQLLEDLRLFETYKPDVVLYDVLGDVVCGGFAAPIREGYAEKVLIVTSGEKMALYAANNISSAVRNFEDRSYARVFGIVLNHRNVENEVQKVQAFSKESGIPIVGEIPRSDEIIRYEDQGQTVIEGNPESEISGRFYDLAKKLLESEE